MNCQHLLEPLGLEKWGDEKSNPPSPLIALYLNRMINVIERP